MSVYKIKTTKPEETHEIAKKLGYLLHENDVILLEGDLGAGKTTFSKGIGLGLGVKRTINSPTFTIIKEYKGRLPFYHMDVYRLEDQFEDFGFDEYFYGGGVTVVEWAQFIEEQLPEEYLTIHIQTIGEQERNIQLIPHGKRYEQLCKELTNESISD